MGLAAGAVAVVVVIAGIGRDGRPENIIPVQSTSAPGEAVRVATVCQTQFGTCPLTRDMPPGTPCDCTNASGEVLAAGNAR